eukprot:COSAG02_NODE_9987_length_2057_cov_1.283453_2_plen_87_part_00
MYLAFVQIYMLAWPCLPHEPLLVGEVVRQDDADISAQRSPVANDGKPIDPQSDAFLLCIIAESLDPCGQLRLANGCARPTTRRTLQ